MKSTIRHYGPVALLLAVILAVSSCLSLLTGKEGENRAHVLVTTYPLYVAAQNVLGDTDGVELSMLAAVGAGCLHDYQLTPADRLALERADKVIINGAGAEPFLEGLVDESRLVDTSAGMDLLCAETDHHHEGEEHHHEEYNEHVWVSPARYYLQVLAVLSAFEEVDPTHYDTYLENATAYVDRMEEVGDRFPFSLGRPCVLFHDSLAYLAEYVGLDVKLTLSAEGESGLSAADLAKVEALAKEYPDLVLLYDTQYPIRYTAIDDLVPAGNVLALETAVVGEGKPSDWLDAMERNLEKLQKLTGGDTP